MTDENVDRLELACLILSAALLSCALATRVLLVGILGGCLFSCASLVGLYGTYRVAKAYTPTFLPDDSPGRKRVRRIINILGGTICIAGLVALVVGNGSHSHGIQTVGAIVWGSAIGAHVVAGPIVGWVTNLPIRHGYGGWEISHPKRRSRR